MDALFEDAPLFVAGTEYAKMKDRHSAERELREGQFTPHYEIVVVGCG
jgi:hypothetical protein